MGDAHNCVLKPQVPRAKMCQLVRMCQLAKYRNELCNYVKKCEECEGMFYSIKDSQQICCPVHILVAGGKNIKAIYVSKAQTNLRIFCLKKWLKFQDCVNFYAYSMSGVWVGNVFTGPPQMRKRQLVKSSELNIATFTICEYMSI